MGERRATLVLLLIFGLMLFAFSENLVARAADTPKKWVFDSEDNISDFTVANGKVFVMTFHEELFCLDELSGGLKWIFDSEGNTEWNMGRQIRVAYGKVFVGSQGSVLSCLDEETGLLLWQFQPSLVSSNAEETTPDFSIADGRVYTSGDGFYALDASTGALLWSYEDQQSSPDFVTGWGFEGNKVFGSGLEEGVWRLYRFNPDNGDILWTSKTWNAQIHLYSSPVSVDGLLYLLDYNEGKSLSCIDDSDGGFIWVNYVFSDLQDYMIFPSTLSDGLVLFGASDGNFYALNDATGEKMWEFAAGPEGSGGYSSFESPKVSSGKVVIAPVLDWVEALSISDGKKIWSNNLSPNAHGLTLGNNEVYVVHGGNLVTLDLNTGELKWWEQLDYWILPPLYINDTLFVAAENKLNVYDSIVIPEFPSWAILPILLIASIVVILVKRKTLRAITE